MPTAGCIHRSDGESQDSEIRKQRLRLILPGREQIWGEISTEKAKERQNRPAPHNCERNRK